MVMKLINLASGVLSVRKSDDVLETHVQEMDEQISQVKQDIVDAIQRLTEASVDTGVADDTSTVNQLDDASKDWPVGEFDNLIIEVTSGTGAGQIRKISTNGQASITPVSAFDTAPDSTSQYRIGFFGKMAGDITAWGGTAQTGADLTPLLQNLDAGLSTRLAEATFTGRHDNVWGALTYSVPAGADVGTGTTQIVAANANRKMVVVVNDSDTDVFLTAGNNAVMNSGIRINAGGGSAQFGGPGGLPLTTQAINGIHGDIGTKHVTVQEGE